MTAVFIDTGGFFAAHVAQDRWHKEASAALRALIERRVPLVSTPLVRGETYTLLRMRFGKAAAWRFMEVLGRSHTLRWLPVDPEVDAQAWALLRQFGDQPFSYVDATSFVVMRAHKLRRALAFDAHFAAAGFTRVGLDAPVQGGEP